MGCGCKHPFISKGGMRGFGSDVDNLDCPPGYTLKAERIGGEDKFWCEDANGNRLGANVTPVVPQGQRASVTGGGGLGVLGWSILASAAVVGAALVVSASRRS